MAEDASVAQLRVDELERRIEAAVCEGFSAEQRAWAGAAIRDVLMSKLPMLEEGAEELGAADALIQLLDAPSSEERYGRLVTAYYEALVRELSEQAFLLALHGRR